MPPRERLYVQIIGDSKGYKREVASATKATQSWVQDTDKAGKAAERAASKSQGAFAKITNAVRGAQKEARKGADFEMRSKGEGVLGKLRSGIRSLRGEANKGADFEMRSRGEGLIGRLGRGVRSLRAEAGKGADFKLRADASQVDNADKMIGRTRSNADRGANFKVRADSSQLDGIQDKLSGIGETAAGVAGGIAAEDMMGGLTDNFREASMAAGGFEGRLNATKGQAQALSGVGRDVFKGAWGGSLAEVNQAVTTVAQGLGTMDNAAKTQKLTEQALTLSDAFGMDVTESVEAARLMSQNFGISGSRAMDLVAAGARDGANTSGDLLDSLREYSPMFSRLGINGSQAMAMFAEGTKQGIWNTDRLGDSIKEFSVRAVDGSDTTKEGFKMAGLNAQEMSRKIAQGGPTAEKAFQRTVSAIQGIEDPQKRAQAGVALFGTLYEDIGEKGLRAMSKGAEGMNKVDGAAKQTGDSLYNNFTTRMQGAMRSVQMFAADSGLGPLTSGLGGVVETAGMAGMAVAGIGIGAPAAAGKLKTVGSAAAGMGSRLMAVTRIAPLVGGAITLMTGPIGIAIAAVGALAGATYLIYRNWDKVGPFLSEKAEQIRGAVSKIPGLVIQGLGKLPGLLGSMTGLWAGALVGLIVKTGQVAIPAVKTAVSGIAGWFGKLPGRVRAGVSNLPSTVVSVFQAVRNQAPRIIGGLVNDSVGFIRKLPGRVGGILSGWVKGFVGHFRKAYNRIVGNSIIPDLVNGVVDWIRRLPKRAMKAISGFVGNFASKFTTMKNRGIKLASNLKAGTVNQFEKMRSGGRGRIAQLVTQGLAKFTNMQVRGLKVIGSFVTGGISKYQQMREGGATRFEALRGAIGSQLAKARDIGSARIRELGSRLGTSFTNQLSNARDKFSAVRDAIGNRTAKARDWASDNISKLGTNLKNSFSDILSGVTDFGQSFWNRIKKWFGKAINSGRFFLGALLGAAGTVMNTFGAEGIGSKMKDAEKRMKAPVKFARGGIAKGDRGGVLNAPVQVGGEAGKESLVPLTRWTPGGQKAYNAATPLYGDGGRKHRREHRGHSGHIEGDSWRGGGTPGSLRYTFVDPNTNTMGWYGSPKWLSEYRTAKSDWESKTGIGIPSGGNQMGVGTEANGVANGRYGVAKPNGSGYTTGIIEISGDQRASSTAIRSTWAHEIGHALGLSHNAPSSSIMKTGRNRNAIYKPTSRDVDLVKRLHGGGSGGGPDYGNLKGRIHDGGSGSGIYGPTDNSLWTDDTFGRVIEVLKRFRVSANTYRNHPPARPEMAPHSADFWGYNGRGTPISRGLNDRVRRFIETRLSRGLGWVLGEGDDSVHSGRNRHVHATWTGSDPTTPNVKYRGGTGGGGGPSLLERLRNAWQAALPDIPDIGLGLVGDGFKSLAQTAIQKGWQFIKKKAMSGILGAIGSAVGGLFGGGGQKEMARFMGAEADKRGIDGRLPVMTAIQESGLRTGEAVRYKDHDSVGPFQIRHKLHNMSRADAEDVGISTDWFLDRAEKYKGQYPSTATGLGNWAQKVQVSAYPDAYAEHFGEAGRLLGMRGDRARKREGDPRLAAYLRGGIIPGPKGKDVMLQAHAGERVLSERNNAAFEKLARSVENFSSRAHRGMRVSPEGRLAQSQRNSDRHLEKRLAAIESLLAEQKQMMQEAPARTGAAVGKGVDERIEKNPATHRSVRKAVDIVNDIERQSGIKVGR